MPNLRVDFICEGCGERVHWWLRQPVSTLRHNAAVLADDCDNGIPEYLVCRKCQKTVVYDEVVYVEHDPSQGEYSDVIFATSKNGHSYFAIGADTMDAICDAWQKYRGDDNG